MRVVGDRSRTLDDLLRSAIAARRLIRFTYDSSDIRTVEPHDYGVQNGVTRVLAYQRQGRQSQGRGAVGWRLFDTAKIRRCEMLDETFPGSRGDFHENHYAWDVLYARVS